jgi:hypothetical protein
MPPIVISSKLIGGWDVGGTPHTCYQDDVYEGYDIQKGTIV